jgi:transposase
MTTQLEQWRFEIESGELVVFMLDECHLLWGDVCGYVWGKKDERVVVPMLSQRQRQTYFGALNYRSKEFVVQAYDKGNTEHTITFLKYLLEQCPHQRIAVIWDGASYHRSSELKAYLETVNQGLDPDQWKITCIRLAPNAPQQNPVEDIWLAAKRWIRECYHLCCSFEAVQLLFELVTHRQVFNFPKLHEYGVFS